MVIEDACYIVKRDSIFHNNKSISNLVDMTRFQKKLPRITSKFQACLIRLLE